MTNATSASPKTYQCRHLFTDGHRCGSRSLRGEDFCFYHHKTRKPFPKAAPAPPAEAAFDLPFPEDRAAIQLSIGEVLRRIASNEIDPRRAGLLLYGLQIASLNLPQPAAKSRSSRRTEEEEEEPEIPEEIVLHPDLGPLAPEAEYVPYQRPLTYVGRLLRELGEDEEDPILPAIQATDAASPFTDKAEPSNTRHSQKAGAGISRLAALGSVVDAEYCLCALRTFSTRPIHRATVAS